VVLITATMAAQIGRLDIVVGVGGRVVVVKVGRQIKQRRKAWHAGLFHLCQIASRQHILAPLQVAGSHASAHAERAARAVIALDRRRVPGEDGGTSCCQISLGPALTVFFVHPGDDA